MLSVILGAGEKNNMGLYVLIVLTQEMQILYSLSYYEQQKNRKRKNILF